MNLLPPFILVVSVLGASAAGVLTNTDQLVFPEPMVDTNPPAPSTLTLAWNPSLRATGYSLNQWAGSSSLSGTTVWNTPFTNVTISYQWGDEPYRFLYAVMATNATGQAALSGLVPWPPYPSTHVILNWQGKQAIQQSSDLRVWSPLTNGTGPLTLPIMANRFYRGTNMVIQQAP